MVKIVVELEGDVAEPEDVSTIREYARHVLGKHCLQHLKLNFDEISKQSLLVCNFTAWCSGLLWLA